MRLITPIQVIKLRRLVANDVDILQRSLMQVDVPCIRAASSRDGGKTLVGKVVGRIVLGSETTSREWRDEYLGSIVTVRV